jgi:hypothetical protein
LVNVDAVVFSDLQKVGVGVVVRDHTRVCLVASNQTSPFLDLHRLNLQKYVLFNMQFSLARDERLRSAIFMAGTLSLIQLD